MKIALATIATGRYDTFLPPLLDSAEFFCRGHDVRFFVFSNHEPGDVFNADREYFERIDWTMIRHEPWPGPTLHRYHSLLRAASKLAECEYIFHCDVDMLFAGDVGAEICGPGLTATIHPGYAGKRRSDWTYEYRPQSRAFIRQGDGRRYYCGGFQGGRAADYLAAMRTMAANIDADTAAGLTALWHDESHWNRYLLDHPPAMELSPLYCSPESWHVPGRKLVCLDKNHKEFQVA